MKTATGVKIRRIRAANASTDSSFSFNRSITPYGGAEAEMHLKPTRGGFRKVKICQDLNDDGIISSNEIIYKGRSTQGFDQDALLHFNGEIKLSKSMHRCEWVTQKYPGENILCTREFIPTTYSLSLFDQGGERFGFAATGAFLSPFLVD